MNKLLSIIIFFISYSCNQINKNETDIIKILVKKVDPNIDTSISIDCNTFQSVFKNEVHLEIINSKSVFFELDKFLKDSNESLEKSHVDTRKQIIIYYSNKNNDTLCVDKFNIILNSKLLKKQTSLKKFLDNL